MQAELTYCRQDVVYYSPEKQGKEARLALHLSEGKKERKQAYGQICDKVSK